MKITFTKGKAPMTAHELNQFFSEPYHKTPYDLPSLVNIKEVFPFCECGTEVQHEGDICTSCAWSLKNL